MAKTKKVDKKAKNAETNQEELPKLNPPQKTPKGTFHTDLNFILNLIQLLNTSISNCHCSMQLSNITLVIQFTSLKT